MSHQQDQPTTATPGLAVEILALDKELEVFVRRLAPALLEVCGCSTLTAGKIVGETADVRRFRSRHAYAGPESLRALKRRLSDVVYRALLADADAAST